MSKFDRCSSGYEIASSSIHSAARAATRKAAFWLAEFADRRLATLEDKEVCLSVTGLSCATRILNEPTPPLVLEQAAQHSILELLRRFSGTNGHLGFQHQHSLIALMMSAAHVVSDDTDAARFRKLVAEQWLTFEQQSEPQESSRLVWAARCLGAALGERFSFHPTLLCWESAIQLCPNEYIVDLDSIRGIVADLAILTMHGSFEPQLIDSQRSYLLTALPFWMFFYIKERDLDAVCPLVRGLKYMGMDGVPEFSDGIQFILSQAREDGRFGMLDMPAYLQALQSPRSLDIDRDLSLPLTTASLWTLLECLFPEYAPLANVMGRDA